MSDAVEVILIVHGFVQGVGYRSLVRIAAERNGIRGRVMNLSDGSVEIVAIGGAGSIKRFEKEIDVSMKNGPQVMRIERSVKNRSMSRCPVSGFRVEGEE